MKISIDTILCEDTSNNNNLTINYISLKQVIDDIKQSVQRMNLEENQRWVVLMFDEMKMQSDVVN